MSEDTKEIPAQGDPGDETPQQSPSPLPPEPPPAQEQAKPLVTPIGVPFVIDGEPVVTVRAKELSNVILACRRGQIFQLKAHGGTVKFGRMLNWNEPFEKLAEKMSAFEQEFQ
jgi:hypothetical protein